MNLKDMRRSMRLAAALSVVVVAACGGRPADPVPNTEPRFEGTGPHRRAVATASKEAQFYFDQGLAFLYAFNHDEAIRFVPSSAALDWIRTARWHIVGRCLRQRTEHQQRGRFRRSARLTAFAAAERGELRLARGLDGAGPSKPRLVGSDRDALRVAATQRPRSPWTKRLRQPWARSTNATPEDGDVGALYAEALLDLHPWDLARLEQDGSGLRSGPPSWSAALLEEVLERDQPNHPLAIHLYIHAVEACERPRGAPTPPPSACAT